MILTLRDIVNCDNVNDCDTVLFPCGQFVNSMTFFESLKNNYVMVINGFIHLRHWHFGFVIDVCHFTLSRLQLSSLIIFYSVAACTVTRFRRLSSAVYLGGACLDHDGSPLLSLFIPAKVTATMRNKQSQTHAPATNHKHSTGNRSAACATPLTSPSFPSPPLFPDGPGGGHRPGQEGRLVHVSPGRLLPVPVRGAQSKHARQLGR